MKPALKLRSSRKPIRTCLGCGETDVKSTMVRVAASAGGVRVDVDSRLGGRGGYLHARRRCLELFVAAKRKSFTSLGQGLSRTERRVLADQLEHLVSLSSETEN